MKHRVSTIKFKYGKDANKMLTRKLLKNFVVSGRMTTTEKKIKLVKRQVEKLVQLAKRNTETSRVLLRSHLADRRVEDVLIKYVAPVFKDRVSGFTTLVHLPQRESDGAIVARLQWSVPVVIEKPIKKKAKQEDVAEKEDKKTAPTPKKVSEKTKKV